MAKATMHRFRTVPKTGRKGRRNQTKKVRMGARTPGAQGQGSIRRPY